MVLNKTVILSAVAGTFLIAGTSAVSRTVAVSGPPTLGAWSERVYRDLSDHLAYPRAVLGQVPTGTVAVKFNCSETGAPAGITLYKSSGWRSLDEATLRGLRRIATLHPLPSGMVHNQQFVIRVLFADSQESAQDQIRKMQADAVRSNAWFGKTASSVASTIDLAPPAG